ncbi:hypothetical protein PV328_001009 [Microctonus aethiopoides]|uniref:Mutator-like transposase domain-containing protein n=1 Tax=Microctonus aethiopoides TaxID=144406 RepID=A0AA39FWN5_9HYME|nr:hypothetical protein PV328_001009 [Microctonus aethiopoides]
MSKAESNRQFLKKKLNLDFVSENDSSAIAAVRNAVNYEILKVDDTNHKSKGVTSTLYKIKPGFKELNNTVIQYLGNCFNYCVVQNVGNSESMSAAIKIFQFIVSMTTEITTNGVDLKKILTLISTQSSVMICMNENCTLLCKICSTISVTN